MALHHELAVESFIAAARRRTVLGVIIVGSVARGTERSDSDVDLYELVDDVTFGTALTSGIVARVETDHAGWPGGYFDIKLVSPALLQRAARDADDATRASFVGARVEIDRDGGLENLLARIVTPGPEYFDRHIAAFSAQFALHADYFLVHGREQDNLVLATNAAVHAAFAAGRMALAAERILFRGPKYLDAQLREAGYLALADAAAVLVDEKSQQSVDIVRALVPQLRERGDTIDDITLGRFITDNEWAWFTGRTPPEYR